MRQSFLAIVFGGLVLFMGASPVPAHHSFAAEFSQDKPLTLKGVVTKVEFANPHIYFYIDVKDADGNTKNWAVEGGPPNVLRRQGWKKDSLKPGDNVTVQGFAAKDGSSLASASTVTLPDGQKVYSGNAAEYGGSAGQTGSAK
jgi:hypothetical protein